MAKLPSFTVITTVGAVCGSLIIYKDYINGPIFKGNENFEGKVAVLTGANSGIGKETAAFLASKKFKVIMACRDMAKCNKIREDIVLRTKNPRVSCKPLNLASLESVRSFANYVNSKEPILNILINNAGIMNCPKAYTQNNFEAHFGVNYLGHFLLTIMLLPKLQANGPSKIINIIDPICRKGKLNTNNVKEQSANQELTTNYDGIECYKSSKLALVAFSQELALRLKNKEVEVICVNPGIVNTSLQRYLPSNTSWISRYTWAPLLQFFIKDPFYGSQPIVYAACRSPSFTLEPTLVSSGHTTFIERPLSSLVKVDEEIAHRLWNDSLEYTEPYRVS